MLVRRKRPRLLRAIFFLTLYLIALPLSVTLASSGGGQEAGPKGWVATDTYRVMNFVLLAGGLIFFLRKPLSQALRGRIKGVQDQLSGPEGPKKEAGKKLAADTGKLGLLGPEGQKVIDEDI